MKTIRQILSLCCVAMISAVTGALMSGKQAPQPAPEMAAKDFGSSSAKDFGRAPTNHFGKSSAKDFG